MHTKIQNKMRANLKNNLKSRMINSDNNTYGGTLDNNEDEEVQLVQIQKCPRGENRIYYNIFFTTDKPEGEPARYQVNLSDTLIDIASDYNLAVVRFEIPITNIPFVIFRIDEGITQTNRNKGEYSFTISYNQTDFTNHIEYETTSLDINILPPPPSLNNGHQYFTTEGVEQYYYYMYHADDFVYLMNKTLQTIIDSILFTYPLLAPLPAPYVKYNSVSGLINFVFPRKFITENIDLFYNFPLEQFLFSSPSKFVGGNVKFNQVILREDPNFDNAYYPPGVIPTTPPELLQTNPNWAQIEEWAELKSIIFNSSQLPVRREVSSSTSNVYIVEPIITDFIVQDWNGTRSSIVFNSQGNYRFMDLLGKNKIRNIDIQLFWTDKKGVKRPFLIYDKSSPITMKLAFIEEGLVS